MFDSYEKLEKRISSTLSWSELGLRDVTGIVHRQFKYQNEWHHLTQSQPRRETSLGHASHTEQ